MSQKDLPFSKRSHRISKDDLRNALDHYSRAPFLDVLAIFLQKQPTPKAIQEFSNDYPDRWANALATIARISGFNEKVDIDINVFQSIASMSDAQLLQRLEDMRRKSIELRKDEILQIDVCEAHKEKAPPNE